MKTSWRQNQISAVYLLGISNVKARFWIAQIFRNSILTNVHSKSSWLLNSHCKGTGNFALLWRPLGTKHFTQYLLGRVLHSTSRLLNSHWSGLRFCSSFLTPQHIKTGRNPKLGLMCFRRMRMTHTSRKLEQKLKTRVDVLWPHGLHESSNVKESQEQETWFAKEDHSGKSSWRWTWL